MKSNTWEFKRPDWTDGESYQFIEKLSYAKFAWEFLRRKKRYRNDYTGWLDKTPVADRKKALRLLRMDAPLRWFVPKKGGAAYGKIEQTLGDFVQAVKTANAGDPRKWLRVRKANPKRYSIDRFVDPNESPLKDESIFIEDFVEFRTAEDVEDWGDEEKVDFLDLNDYHVAMKVDLRFPAVRTIKLIKGRLREYRSKLRSKNISNKPKRGDRILLLRVFDSNQERNELKKGQRRKNIYEVLRAIFKDEVNSGKRYYRLLSRAKYIAQSNYKFIARLR